MDSNRLSSASTPAAADGSCVSSGGVTVSHQYDGADRLLPTGPDTGLVYDHYGRTTTLPAASSNQPSPTTAAYYNIDQVKSLSQTVNGTAVTRSWNPDAAGRRRTMTDSAGPAKTSHYSNGGDNPDWIDEANSSYTTYTTGLGTDLAVATTGTATTRTTTINLTNLHGDITTTQPLGGGTLGPQQDTDEFGNPHNPNTPTNRYSWLGGKQRNTDALGGVVLMGVRLYSPALGRFLQVDPIKGGNAHDYDYSYQDPINNFDLDGRWGWKKWFQRQWYRQRTVLGDFKWRKGRPALHWNRGHSRVEWDKSNGWHYNKAGQSGHGSVGRGLLDYGRYRGGQVWGAAKWLGRGAWEVGKALGRAVPIFLPNPQQYFPHRGSRMQYE